ncbi:hypothetical protein DCAR_0519288 [Daucus carota subsp. sativus]|uniref:Uncharacterized protein n=1 Tax=Daucus carota subsp. sativus TaxID=79200 RepID=A0A161YJU6_DAUCS|nr:hypothetical protein DCAR_0519288 [Daucus carota subsp. sativus]
MSWNVINATVRIYFVGNDKHPWTDMIVASNSDSGQTMILTVAHALQVEGMLVEEVEQDLRVKFYEDDEEYSIKICL